MDYYWIPSHLKGNLSATLLKTVPNKQTKQKTGRELIYSFEEGVLWFKHPEEARSRKNTHNKG